MPRMQPPELRAEAKGGKSLMASVSGLSAAHRAQVRADLLRGVRLLASNPNAVHYTQGANRWDGIAHHKLPGGKLFPFSGDCSSTATWLLWLGLHHRYGVRDVVNGAGWTGGFTGTIARHGKPVIHDHNLTVGDLILYGNGPTYEHVTVSLGGRRVFSHGNERGPVICDMDYRLDRGPARRFI